MRANDKRLFQVQYQETWVDHNKIVPRTRLKLVNYNFIFGFKSCLCPYQESHHPLSKAKILRDQTYYQIKTPYLNMGAHILSRWERTFSSRTGLVQPSQIPFWAKMLTKTVRTKGGTYHSGLISVHVRM